MDFSRASAFFSFLGKPFQFPFDRDQIVQDQFAVHGLDIPQRIDAAGRVGYLIVFKTADHMDESIHLSKLVEQCSGDAVLARAAVQTANVHIGDLGIDGFLGLEHLGELVHPGIGYIDHGGVHFQFAGDSAGGDGSAGKCIE